MAEGLSSDQAKTHSGPPDSLTRASRLASTVAAGASGIAVSARGQTVGQAAGRQRLEGPVERFTEEGLKPVQDVGAGAACVESIGSAVPEDRESG